jgi:DNA-binding NarL/FixJ family response regulator
VAKINNLSSQEYEIASQLLKGLSTNNIAQKIGRKATTISTIKNNIFKKLEVDNIIKLPRVLTPWA